MSEPPPPPYTDNEPPPPPYNRPNSKSQHKYMTPNNPRPYTTNAPPLYNRTQTPSNNMNQPGSRSQRSNNMNTSTPPPSNNIQPGSESQRSNNMNTSKPQPSTNMDTSTSQPSNNIQPGSRSQHQFLTEDLVTYKGHLQEGLYIKIGSRFERDGNLYIARNDASEYPGYNIPVDLKYGFYLFEKFPFINLKTLTYRPYNALMYSEHETQDMIPFNNNDKALVNTLIDFMNMQELPIRIALAKALTEVFRELFRGPRKEIIYRTFTYTTAEENHAMRHTFYGFDIIRFIEKYRDKYDLLHFFLDMMSFVRNKIYKGNLNYKGFVLKSTNRGNNRDTRKSYNSKKLKFQGMINCCILDDNKCTNEEPGRFFGTRKKVNPTLCTYTSSPVTRAISSGGRRHMRHKRKTRRTRR